MNIGNFRVIDIGHDDDLVGICHDHERVARIHPILDMGLNFYDTQPKRIDKREF